MADTGLLLVLDNLETLLTPEGGWRDPRWEMLITALTNHDGESRSISRRAASSPRGSRQARAPGQVAALPVHALNLGEAAALARELPNLSKLLHAHRSDAGGWR